MRLLQGLAIGSDLAAPAVYLAEHGNPTASVSSPGLLASLVPASAALGALLASAVCWIIAAAMSPAALGVWGWRLPLVGSLVVGAVHAALRVWVLRDPQAGMNAAELAECRGDNMARKIRSVLRLVIGGGGGASV